MKSFSLSLLASILLVLPGQGQTRQFTLTWPLPAQPANVPWASWPVPVLGQIGYFETNIDKLQNGPYGLLFDGDTITDGWSDTGESVWQQFYGSMSAVEIGNPYVDEQVQNITWRAQNGSLAGQDPQLIVVEAGTWNYDGVQTPSQVAAGIQLLVAQYEARCPRSHILLLAIFPRGFTTTDPGRVWVGQVNAILASINFGPQVTYMDIGAQFLQPDGTITATMMPDGVDPSAEGYTVWANAIAPVVSQYVTDAPAYTYALTVTGGSGGGSYTAGTAVTVTAAAPPSGSHFTGWTGNIGTLANPSAATTNLTMMAQPMSITATYASTQTTPSAPSGFTATDGISQNNLNWTAVTGATSYNVYRGTTTGGESATPIATGIASASYNDTSLPNNTTLASAVSYYYTVAAVNSSGTSAFSSESSATPIFFPVTGLTRPITFDWPAPSLPSNVATASWPVPIYYPWLGTFESNIDLLQSGPYDLVFDGDSITAGWVAGGITVWQQYFGALKALDLGIGGDQVENVTWRLQNGDLAGQDPKLFVQLAGSANVGQNPSDVAAGVELLAHQIETSCPNTHILLLAFIPRGPVPTSYDRVWAQQVNQIVSGLNSGDSRITYLDVGSQLIAASGSLLAGAYGDTIHPTILGYNIIANAIQPVVNQYVVGPTAPPSAPTGLATGSVEATLTWTCGTGATSFNVYRGTTPGGESATPVATGVATTAYTDASIVTGTTYYYKVASVNNSGTSSLSSEISVTPTTISTPSAPTGLTAVAGNTQVTLNWTASAGATSYNVYRGSSSGGESTTAIATAITNTTYTDTGLTNGATYYYEVVAVNDSGTSAYSNEASTAPSSSLGAPTGLTAIAGNAEASLSWTAGSAAISYNVYRGTSAGGESITPVATGITGTNYINTGLTNGEPYFYKVTSVNSSGTSAYSNEATATPLLDAGLPWTPTGLTAAAGNGNVSLSWTTSAWAVSYNIYRATTSGSEGAVPIATGITSTSYTNTGLTNGTAYYYEVTAVNTSGTSGYSDEAIATPVASTQITWGTAQNMTGDADVANNGAYFDAVTFHGSAVTVNGVVFNPSSSDTTISFTGSYFGGYTPFMTATPSSVNYSNATAALVFVIESSGLVSISGLTPGHSYQVQAWTYDSGDSTANGATTFTGANSVTVSTTGNVGQFAVGTFTSGSSEETFNYIHNGEYGVINAVSVRDITVATGTPYAQWSNNYFASNPALGGGAATPLNDGVTNLLKYLFDINPTLPMSASDRAALPAAGIITLGGSSYLTLTYRQNPLETGLTIQVQTSADLQNWQTIIPNNTTSVGTDPATGDPLIQIQIEVTPLGTSKEFIRMRVGEP